MKNPAAPPTRGTERRSNITVNSKVKTHHLIHTNHNYPQHTTIRPT